MAVRIVRLTIFVWGIITNFFFLTLVFIFKKNFMVAGAFFFITRKGLFLTNLICLLSCAISRGRDIPLFWNFGRVGLLIRSPVIALQPSMKYQNNALNFLYIIDWVFHPWVLYITLGLSDFGGGGYPLPYSVFKNFGGRGGHY